MMGQKSLETNMISDIYSSVLRNILLYTLSFETSHHSSGSHLFPLVCPEAVDEVPLPSRL